MSQPQPRDLMHTQEIKALVHDTYHAAASPAGAVARKLYPAYELAQVPQIAIDGALGVASPLRHAGIVPGDTVLDLGCGYGIDTILAARRTGPAGRVIALDFLPAMLERTAAAAAQAGLRNVETLHADIEDIPLPDRSVDQIISNGVLNLCPRKARAFAECRRVLRPGGKLCVADMTVEDNDLPAEVLAHPAAWTSCTAGALTEHDFARKLGKAGFGQIQIVDRQPQSIDDLAVYPLFPAELLQLMRIRIPPAKHASVATAIVIKAVARPQTEPRPRAPISAPGNHGGCPVSGGQELLGAQREQWQATFRANPDMYGTGPSEPGAYAAGLFAREQVRDLLELGAGQGRDSLEFLRAGLTVTALDYAAGALTRLQQATTGAGLAGRLTTVVHDVREPLPLPDGGFDAVYSHMLFNMALTTAELETLSGEVHRVLRSGGLHVYTVRHTGDAHYGAGTSHGDNMFENGGFIVHFFDRALVDRLATGFTLLDLTPFEEGTLPRRLWRITLRREDTP